MPADLPPAEPGRADPAEAGRSGGGISRGLVVLLAVATGASAANLYYAQPLLQTIGHALGVGSGTAGLVVTLSQVGYATGLALVVPIGDIVQRSVLVRAVLGLTALALVASALAPTISVLIALAFFVGLGSVAAQILVPLAASLADDASRGRVVGTVMSGLLLGILLARTVSGLVAGASSWRVIYWVAAGAMVVLAAVLGRWLPPDGPRPRLSYRELLASTVALLGREPLLRRRTLFGALAFAAFSIFWTPASFLLAGPPYHYHDTVIGLFGLIGAAGAVCATLAGRLADRGATRWATTVFAVAIGGSFALLALGAHHLVPLIAGVVVLDIGVQGLHITNQSLVYALAPESRSRINACYMVGYFLGGAIGSAAASACYSVGGWGLVCVIGGAAGAGATALSAFPGPARARPAPTRVGATGDGEPTTS